jgi:hypothetical protein
MSKDILKVVDLMMNNLRSRNGLSWERFRSYHSICGVEPIDLPTKNSAEVDPTTSDLKPLFRKQLHCSVHNVSSLIEETIG